MKVFGKATPGASAGGKGLVVLFALVVILILITLGIFFSAAVQDKHDKEYITLLGEQRVLSQRMTSVAGQAAQGRKESFEQLKGYRAQFTTTLAQLNADAPIEVRDELAAVSKIWERYNTALEAIVSRQKTVLSLRDSVRLIDEKASALSTATEEAVNSMASRGASSNQVNVAGRELMVSQRILTNVNRLLEGGEAAVTAADRFGRDAVYFERVLRGLLEGNPEMGIDKVRDGEVRTKLEQVQKAFGDVNGELGNLLDSSPEMFKVSEAVVDVHKNSDVLLQRLTDLDKAYSTQIGSRLVNPSFGVLTGFGALILLGGIVWNLRRQGLQQLARSEEERVRIEDRNKRDQQAIMRLLDEMGDLANGDLTVTATVTEEITGALADSVNYAVEALRDLVTKINDTASRVSRGAEQARATSAQLAEASEHQSSEIRTVSAAVNEITASIENVSGHADELADEARKSVSIAKQGHEAVQKTIHGMDVIREQIQETSKRIKRLGESSQEIGDIVELINDIAEQTNILALNAAIQAAMAGEAGRGFAVVADEVQRLAERSADATKQIEGLVKTIQSDTGEAVTSMEQSTAGVVAGAKLAEDAGKALQAIDDVAANLAELVQSISEATHKQARMAGSIASTMGVIQEFTVQTSSGTNKTADLISNLAALTTELKASVSGFKLPN